MIETLETRTLLSVAVGNPAVVNVIKMPGDQAEGTIVVNPLNPSQVFAASNNNGSSLIGATSNDGGQTWTPRTFATGSDGQPRACCDPSAAFDAFGNLFFAYLGQDSDAAELLLSTDGGQTFTHVATLPGRADQPSVAAGHGEVWVAYQNGGEADMTPSPRNGNKGAKRVPANAGAIVVGAAVTGLGHVGKFGKPQVIAGPAGTNVGDVAVGPAGQVMVAFQSASNAGPSTLTVRVDPDGVGHKPFAKPIDVGATQVGDFYAIPAQPRRTIDAEVGLAFDQSGDAFAGRVYMVYTDVSPTGGAADTDTFLRFSDDDGQSWSTPTRVNDDATNNSQFFPRVAVDPSTGAVGLTWYDCRNDTGDATNSGGTDTVANDEPQLYAAIGTPTADGVALLPNFAITTGFSNTNPASDANDYGDYTGLAFVDGVLMPAWADNSNSTGDNPAGFHAALDLFAAQVPVAIDPAPTRTLLGEFGDEGGSRTLVVAAADGTPVTFRVNHGTGCVFRDGTALDLLLRNSGARTTVAVKTRSGHRVSLGDVTVMGSLRSLSAPTADLTGTFSVNGAVGSLTLGNVAGGAIVATGNIAHLSAASLTDAEVLVGVSVGANGAVGGGDDTYHLASIGRFSLLGSATNSFIAAGFIPADGTFDATDGQVLGGRESRIGPITVQRGIDPNTHFVAGAFGRVRAPKKLNPSTDGRFYLR